MSVFENAKSKIEVLTRDGVKDVGVMTVQMLRQDLAIQFPPASSPGDPPHRRTGKLQNGIEASYSSTGLKVEITSNRITTRDNSLVPFWLEFGTSRMAARPYMRPAMAMADFTVKSSHQAVSKVGT